MRPIVQKETYHVARIFIAFIYIGVRSSFC